MSTLKRIICVALCIIMMQSLALNAFAVEVNYAEESPDEDAFFAFDTGKERMDSDGSFKFSFHSDLMSDHFKPKGTEIKVSISAWLRNIDNTPNWTDPLFPPTDSSKQMSVSLYKCNGTGNAIDSFTICANDTTTTHTFSGLTTGEEYYLEFVSLSTLGTRIRFDGKGKVSNVTVIK